MKEEKLIDALADIDPAYIEEAAPGKARKHRAGRIWIGLAAGLLAVIAAAAALRLRLPAMQPAEPDSAEPGSSSAVQSPSDGTDPGADGQKPTEGVKTDYPEEPEEGAEPGRVTRETLLAYAFGPLKLGMPREELTALYGEPDSRSNTGPVTYEDGITRETWGYRLSGDAQSRTDFTLELADDGSGWVLNEIFLWTDCGLALPHGIHAGMTEEELLAAWPEIRDSFAYSRDGISRDSSGTRYISVYTQGSGDLWFTISLTDGVVDAVSLGPYYRDPPLEQEDPEEEPPDRFSSGNITVWKRTAGGWVPSDYDGHDAKWLEVQFSIEELVSISDTPEDAAYLVDFRNGTAAALWDRNERGAVYRIEDEQAFSEALKAGVFPEDAMTMLDKCRFPAGVWNLLETLSNG